MTKFTFWLNTCPTSLGPSSKHHFPAQCPPDWRLMFLSSMKHLNIEPLWAAPPPSLPPPPYPWFMKPMTSLSVNDTRSETRFTNPLPGNVWNVIRSHATFAHHYKPRPKRRWVSSFRTADSRNEGCSVRFLSGTDILAGIGFWAGHLAFFSPTKSVFLRG